MDLYILFLITLIILAMVSKIDEGLGEIMEALDQKNMLANTVVAFISDNGAPTIGKNDLI